MDEKLDQRLEIRLGQDDKERLALLREVHGVKPAVAIRMALLALCRQLGLSTKNISQK